MDKLIHLAAGPELLLECKNYHGCDIGEAKITGGYRLPAKYVIHTVGPKGENEIRLLQCYDSCLNLMSYYRLKTIVKSIYIIDILYTLVQYIFKI